MLQLTCKVALVAGIVAALAGAQTPREIRVEVKDSSGAALTAASVTLLSKETGREWSASPIDGAAGAYRLLDVPRGNYVLRGEAQGFSVVRRDLRVPADGASFELQLAPATLAQEVLVSAGQIVGGPLDLQWLPGSVGLVTAAQMTEGRMFNLDEALRKVAGVYTRGEDGFGLRPNIGIRGLNPTRSTRVLLFEDGLPLSYAPYGDNSSYYHPPVDRFQEIEVVKGGGQIVYGPMTVGGVINYITPSIPEKRAGSVAVTGGNRDYLNTHLQYGFNLGRTGVLLDATRKQGEGARDHVRPGLTDVNAKTLSSLSARQTLGFRFNYYNERSQVTYSGLRQDEWDRFGARYNPFLNDRFFGDRWGMAAIHTWAPKDDFVMTTSAYGFVFLRNWWRQSSNSGQRPNDSADAACGGMANLLTTCGNEGRLRSYYTWGIDPRFRAGHRLFGFRSEADFGVRYHDELQERIQANGAQPASRTGVTVENNQRIARATSGFVQNRFVAGRWSVTPGVRIENIQYRRRNRLIATAAGDSSLTQVIPGIGVAYSPGRFTFFTGLHRGFAPPRVEDIISNTTGASIELDAEMSWNYEAGVRARIHRDLSIDGTFFRMDFANQIIPASVAGGVGATLTNAGETLHQGMEISGRFRRSIAGSRHSVMLRGAYTLVESAEFRGRRFSSIGGFTSVPITGNRLPYAPRNLLNSSLHYSYANGLNAMVEMVYTGRQFGDDLNTVNGTPDGQRGLLPGNAIWNATVNYPIEAWRSTLFVTSKNVFDRLYITDRARGLLPGAPRLVQVGFRYAF